MKGERSWKNVKDLKWKPWSAEKSDTVLEVFGKCKRIAHFFLQPAVRIARFGLKYLLQITGDASSRVGEAKSFAPAAACGVCVVARCLDCKTGYPGIDLLMLFLQNSLLSQWSAAWFHNWVLSAWICAGGQQKKNDCSQKHLGHFHTISHFEMPLGKALRSATIKVSPVKVDSANRIEIRMVEIRGEENPTACNKNKLVKLKWELLVPESTATPVRIGNGKRPCCHRWSEPLGRGRSDPMTNNKKYSRTRFQTALASFQPYRCHLLSINKHALSINNVIMYVITYGPHKAVAEVSNHNEPIGRKSGIQLERKSMDFTFNCFVLNWLTN